MSTKQDYLDLIEEIRKHDYAYFVQANPLITDYDYDLLVKRVEEIEKRHPDWVSPSSPTQRVGEMATFFAQATHTVPMLSLANTYSEEELKNFMARIHKWANKTDVAFCVELKMDGVAISVRYEKGEFVQGLTRGDGKKGEIVTANLKTIPTLALQLNLQDPPKVLEIRGEIFMPHKAFQRSNQKREEAGLELWANPRNAAAGSLKLLDPKEVKERKLALVFYGIAEDTSQSVTSQFACHKLLEKIGLPTFSPTHYYRTTKLEEVLAFAKRIEKERQHLDFDIDGIVVKVDEFALREDLGVTGKSPRWAVAYKFAPQQAVTKIHAITVQVGRTGVLTPVAELEPVLLAGSTISRATLHNQEEVERKDIRVQDTVRIEKGGDVIPKVVEVDFSKRPKESLAWKMPLHCPSCQHPVVHCAEEVAVRCVNPRCPDQILRRLTYFASKDAMDIEHLGPKVMQQLVEKGLVKSMSDIYMLTEENLLILEGFKEKSAKNLIKSIEKSRKTTLARLILSLGIKYVGEQIAEALANYAREITKICSMSFEELISIEGIGEKVANSVLNYFQDRENSKEIEKLLALGITLEESKLEVSEAFLGKVFVVTGSLEHYSRFEVAALIKAKGGKVSESVGKKTDYLICGREPGAKYAKAQQVGVKILTEEEFRAFIAE